MSCQLHDGEGLGMSIQLAKRRRGRPRKDSKSKQAEAAYTPGSEGGIAYLSQRANTTEGNECVVGQAVTGHIEATFDSGYLLTVRIGNSSINLRGVVFKPGHCVPITPENDVAPHAQMIRRSDVRFTTKNQSAGFSMQTGGVVRSRRKHAPQRAPVNGSQASNHGDTDVHMVEPLSMLPPARPVFVTMQPYPGGQVAPVNPQNKDGASEVVKNEYCKPKTAATDTKIEDSATESPEQEAEDTNEPLQTESSHRDHVFEFGVGRMTELLKAQENSKQRQVQIAEQPTSTSKVE